VNEWTKGLMIAVFSALVGALLIMFGQPVLCTADYVSAATMSAAAPAATPVPLVDAPKYAPQCYVSTAVQGDVLVRSYPGSQFAELGYLSGELTASGVTDSGWVTVDYGERRGWLRVENLRFRGSCETLPTVRDPLIPNALADPDVFAVQIDRDGTGTFSNAISSPDGDTTDVVWVVIINLYTEPPNNLREFTLTLECEGVNTDSVRWGWSYRAPQMTCGDAITLPFMAENNQQPFTITFAPNSPQSYVDYTLRIDGGAAG
jgi:hypothetical protein